MKLNTELEITWNGTCHYVQTTTIFNFSPLGMGFYLLILCMCRKLKKWKRKVLVIPKPFNFFSPVYAWTMHITDLFETGFIIYKGLFLPLNLFRFSTCNDRKLNETLLVSFYHQWHGQSSFYRFLSWQKKSHKIQMNNFIKFLVRDNKVTKYKSTTSKRKRKSPPWQQIV